MFGKPIAARAFLILCGLNVLLLGSGIWLTTQWDPPKAEYPSRPIDLVVPFGAGGGSDAYARIFKKGIEDDNLLSVPLVVQNRGGAGATIGSRYVRDAKPDGYTVLLLHDAIITAKYSGMVRYGPEAFNPVACTGELGMVVAVSADSPYRDLSELMTAACEEPNELAFAVNRGALTHVAGLMLEQAAPGAKFQFPQSGGGNDRFVDLVGGHVDVTGFSLEEFLRYRPGEEDGGDPKLRGLAYLGPERDPAIPDVPTALEQGYDVQIINRFYWWVPKGTPAERIEVLAETLNKALETDYVKRQMAANHCKRIFRTGSELKAQVEKTENKIAQVEFTQPEGVPDMERILMIAVAGLLLVWALKTGDLRFQIGTASALLLCLVFAPRFDHVEGWTLFVGLAGSALGLWHLGPLFRDSRALLSVACTLGYVAALAFGWGDFRWLTIVYVLGIGSILVQNRTRQLPVLGLIAQTLAFGLHAVMTLVFEIPLPT